MEKKFTIKPNNNPIEVRVETNERVPELAKKANLYANIIFALMLSPIIFVIGFDVICTFLSNLFPNVGVLLAVMFIVPVGYVAIASCISMIIIGKSYSMGSINELNNIQKELENNEQFPSNIFKKFDANDFKNWDKDYILIKTEIDDKKRTVSMNVFIPYNSLALL